MGFNREVVSTPGHLAAELAKVDLEDLRKAEREQLEAGLAVVPALADKVSKREPVLVTINGHTDPEADGFDPRHLSVTVSRIEPEAAAQRKADAEEALRLAREAEEAAQAAREAAEEAASRADDEAGSS